MRRQASWCVAGAALMLCACGDVETAIDEPALQQDNGHHGGNANPGLFTPDAHPYGLSMQDWADNWLRWLSLLEGSNTLSWTEPGVVGLGLSISWSDHWL